MAWPGPGHLACVTVLGGCIESLGRRVRFLGCHRPRMVPAMVLDPALGTLVVTLGASEDVPGNLSPRTVCLRTGEGCARFRITGPRGCGREGLISFPLGQEGSRVQLGLGLPYYGEMKAAPEPSNT